MEIIDFYAGDNKDHWLSEINKSDWRAGKYLYELLRDQKLKELCGESTKVLLLIDGDKLISFCTYAEQDVYVFGMDQPLETYTGNPITVIEQLTYLMFIRSLDEKELETEEFENMMGDKNLEKIFPQTPSGQAMRWSKFKDRDPREIFDLISQRVFPAIKNFKNGHLPVFSSTGEMMEVEDSATGNEASTAFSRYMSDAMFLIPTPQVLQKIITGLEDLYEHDISDLDMQGDLYEYMLGKLATAGQNGQFRTPRHIIRMMVELIAPTPDDIICDPACGTAGFLVEAADYIRKNYEDTMSQDQWDSFASTMFTGFDTDRTMLRISAMNLMLHSIQNPEIDYKDSVSKQNDISSKYTVCLANPEIPVQ